MRNKHLIKKADIIIIAVILLIAVIFILPIKNTQNITAEIIVDGTLEHSINLNDISEEYTLELKNGIIISADKNEISVISSDCYGKNCINCGRLTKAGDMAVCIPNKTVIRLSGTQNSGPDAVTY